MPELSPVRPYLLRGFYEWVLDNHCTPYIVVSPDDERAQIPPEAVIDGQVVLNIGPTATQGLEIGNEFVSFGARFSGAHRDIQVPVAAILAIYAKENGRGIAFSEEEEVVMPPPSQDSSADAKRPKLTLVE